MKNFGRVKTFNTACPAGETGNLRLQLDEPEEYVLSTRRQGWRVLDALETRRPDVAEVYPDIREKTRYPMSRIATGCNELQLWDKK
jgi:hypothetical protein